MGGSAAVPEVQFMPPDGQLVSFVFSWVTPAQVETIYGRNNEDAVREQKFGRAAYAALRCAARKGARP